MSLLAIIIDQEKICHGTKEVQKYVILWQGYRGGRAHTNGVELPKVVLVVSLATASGVWGSVPKL